MDCGVVGKPDHDGDPAVHSAVLTLTESRVAVEMRQVEYDTVSWASALQQEGVDPIFIEPLVTGMWTNIISSLPEVERERATATLPMKG